jgi:hypothetical protein
MEESSREWELVKLALTQTKVVLKRVRQAMQNEQRAYHLDEGTIQNILQAEHYISASLQDETSLSRVAQDIEFEKIVNELRAIDLPNTTEEYLIAQQFKDKQ